MSAPRYTFEVGDEVCWVDDRPPRKLEVHDAYVDEVRGSTVSSFLDDRLVHRNFHHSAGWGPEHMAGRFVLVPRHVGQAMRDGHIPRAVEM